MRPSPGPMERDRLLRWLLVLPTATAGAAISGTLALATWTAAGWSRGDLPPSHADDLRRVALFGNAFFFACPLFFVLCGTLTAPATARRPVALALTVAWEVLLLWWRSAVGNDDWRSDREYNAAAALSALGALCGLCAVYVSAAENDRRRAEEGRAA